MFSGKPVIGIAGGIGSGKTLVAQLFGELGCMVISADDLVRRAYQDNKLKQTLRQWWGPMIFESSGEIDRPTLARKIFSNDQERRRLEKVIHPLVNEARQRLMNAGASDAQVLAFVWDTPLLFEVGLHEQCDAVVFVDAPREVRLARVSQARGWQADELESREKSQLPLDRKRETSDYVIDNNTASADEVRAQVREVLSRILARLNEATTSPTPPAEGP
jgi:dephospho-CoA kinase